MTLVCISAHSPPSFCVGYHFRFRVAVLHFSLYGLLLDVLFPVLPSVSEVIPESGISATLSSVLFLFQIWQTGFVFAILYFYFTCCIGQLDVLSPNIYNSSSSLSYLTLLFDMPTFILLTFSKDCMICLLALTVVIR